MAIACQGGGSHTAFTAGVLKRLLGAEELAGVEVVGLSGTSGGAVCALLAWSALLDGDPVAAGPPPDDRACFIHRDYHPGNTLWSGGRLTGVVDWIGGSWGPHSVDLGHMRVNLAADLGLEVADRFLAAHRALTGFDHDPWWDVASAVDCAPEMEAYWRRAEDLVAAALAALGG